MSREVVPVPFVGGTDFGRYSKISLEQTFNMMVANGKSMVHYPGYSKLFALSGDDRKGRAIYNSIPYNHMIAVVDNEVFAITTSLKWSPVGKLTTNNTPIHIAENNNAEIAIIDQENLYIYNTSTQDFSTITLDFKPTYIEFMDGYFIAAVKDSNIWRLSGLNDGKTWPNEAANSGSLQTNPDLVVGTVRINRQLLVMGKTVTEIWHNTAGGTFTFQRDNSIAIPYGCVNSATIAKGFGLVVWLAFNEDAGPTIMFSNGGMPEPISNDGLNFKLDSLTSNTEAVATLFEEDGHIIYQITFPSENLTYAYDFSEKQFYTLTDPSLNHHPAAALTYFNGAHYFVSLNDGSFYEFGSSITTADGSSIPRIRVCKPFRLPSGRRFLIHDLNLTMDQGNSTEGGKISLRLSKDGGHSFGNPLSKDFNEVGNHKNRVRWQKLGSANEVMLQVRVDTKGPIIFTDESTMGVSSHV